MRLVLLPGLDGTGLLFARALDAFGAPAPLVIAYPRDRFLDYPELAALVHDALPDEPVALLAESFSGPVAIRVAASRPPRLRALVLCASFARSPAPAPGRWLGRLLTGRAYRLAPRRALTRWALGRHGTPELAAEIDAALATVRPEVVTSRLRALLGVDVTSEIASVDVPVLCLRARDDRLVPAGSIEPFRSDAKRLTIREIAGPHFLLQSKPREAVAEVRDFLASL